MTTEELCAWHAIRAGWKFNVWVEGDAQWENRFTNTAQYEDPFPATIDGAASAMPPGWDWWKSSVEWLAQTAYSPMIRVRDTGNEVHDRYALAKAAWDAMEPAK